MLIVGNQLSPKVQAECKARFVHRFTRDHRPAWAHGAACKPQFADDADWLANTFFRVTKSGELDKRTAYCESHPTWPEGK